jgi:hypothetical protein
MIVVGAEVEICAEFVGEITIVVEKVTGVIATEVTLIVLVIIIVIVPNGRL